MILLMHKNNEHKQEFQTVTDGIGRSVPRVTYIEESSSESSDNSTLAEAQNNKVDY